MFDVRKYFEAKNNPVDADYQNNLNKVQNIFIEIQAQDKTHYTRYFEQLAQWILLIAEYEKDFSKEYLLKHTFEELKSFNEILFNEIKPENYEKSFLNPEYAVQAFGEKTGQLLCVFYSGFRSFISYATTHMIFKINRSIVQFIQMYEIYCQKGEDYEEFKKIVTYPYWAETYESRTLGFDMRYNPEYAYLTDFIENTDLTDLRYLFYFGNYISDYEIRMAQFVNQLAQDKIDKVMKQTAIAYVEGFKESNKDYTKRKNVVLISMLGMERFTKTLLKELRNFGFNPIVPSLFSKNINQQLGYDHRFDNALVMDEEFVKHSLIESERAIKDYEAILSQCSGSIYFDPFGEEPFAPVNKTAALKLSPEQIEINRNFSNQYSMMFYKAYKREEASFCIIGFPTPEIGDQFEEIFDKTVDINMLDHYEYLKIQQCLIDALDKGEHAHIKGKGNNLTDLYIKLPKLTDPEKQTNFANC